MKKDGSFTLRVALEQLKESRAKNLAEIRKALYEIFEQIMTEDDLEGPFGNIAIFSASPIFAKKPVTKPEHEIVFSLATGKKDSRLWLCLNELEMMNTKYPSTQDSFIKYAADNGGILYGKLIESKDSSFGKLSKLIYNVCPVEHYLTRKNKNDVDFLKQSLAIWLPGPLKAKEIKTAYEHIIISAQDLSDVGIWRESCIICGVFAVGVGERDDEDLLRRRLESSVNYQYFVMVAAQLLAGFAFSESTAHPLRMMSAGSRIQTFNEIFSLIAHLDENEKIGILNRLKTWVWAYPEGFLKRHLLRKIDKFPEQDIENDIVSHPKDLKYISQIAICNEHKKPIKKKYIREIMNYFFFPKSYNKISPFWIFGDIGSHPQTDPDTLESIFKYIDKILIMPNATPRGGFDIWQSLITILLVHGNKNSNLIDDVLPLMNSCIDLMTQKNSEWLFAARDMCIKAYLVSLRKKHDTLSKILKSHHQTILAKTNYNHLNLSETITQISNLPRAQSADLPRGKIAVILSQKGGVGKTFVSTNISYLLAKMGHRTCLLEIDLAGPTLAHLRDVSISKNIRRGGGINNLLTIKKRSMTKKALQRNLVLCAYEGVKMGLLPARPNIFSQRAFIREQNIQSSDELGILIEDLVSIVQKEGGYEWVVIDAPAEFHGMSEAAMWVANRKNGSALFVTRPSRHMYASLLDAAGSYFKSILNTAIVFNGVRKLEQHIYNNGESLTDYLATHPYNDNLDIFPHTKITRLTQILTTENAKHENTSCFTLPWYPDLGEFDKFEDIIKTNLDHSGLWEQLAGWITKE